jgi:hypothetical protein
MFNSGIIFVLALISLSAGAVLIDPVKKTKETSRGFCNVIGFFVIILSIIILLFSGYCMLKTYSYTRHMMYRGQMPMQQQMAPGMRGHMMMDRMQKKNYSR